MSFESDVRQVEDGLVEGVNVTIVRTALATLGPVVRGTPVGNAALWKANPSGTPRKPPPGYAGGRARGNWTVSIGSEDSNELNTRDKSGSGTISKGRAVLSRYSPPWKTVFIQNNVPYIQRLNEGHSKQARPGGFVERAIQAGLVALNGEGEIIK